MLHDNGGYGMLGFGHNHPAIDAALGRPQVMANVMTPSVAQLRFTQALNRELGRNRGSNHVLFSCHISGSAGTGRTLTCREWSRTRSECPGSRMQHHSSRGLDRNESQY